MTKSNPANSESPIIPAVIVQNIPKAMSRYDHLVEWRYEYDGEAEDGEVKWRKVPLVAGGTGGAQSNNPATWRAWAVAVSAYQRHAKDTPGETGLGYVFAKDGILKDNGELKYPKIKPADGDTLVFIDLDKCIDEFTGELSARAIEIKQRCHTYAERSPSKTGIHIYGHGRIPKSYKTGGVEIYEVGRFTTLTGDHLEDTPLEVNDIQEALDWLVEQLQAELDANNGYHHPHRERPPVAPLNLSDTQLLAKIKGSKQGPLFHELYDQGKWEHRYKSQSEGVFALLGILAFWTQCDGDRMDRFFRESEMMSGKWLHKWDDIRGDTTLGALEISKMIEETDEVYAGPTPRNKSKLDQAFDDKLRTVTAHRLSTVESKRVYWAVQDYIPLGFLTVCAAPGDAGKSSVDDDFMVRLANGVELPGGLKSDLDGPVVVAVFTTENPDAEVMRPRMEATARLLLPRARWDRSLENILVGDGVEEETEPGSGIKVLSIMSFPRDVEPLRAFIRREHVKVLFFDPLLSYTDGAVHQIDAGSVRRFLDPLARLAKDENVAIVAVIHFSKRTEGDFISKISGSHQFKDTARSVYTVLIEGATPTGDIRRWLASAKMNVGQTPLAMAFSFSIVPHPVQEFASDGMKVNVVTWERGMTRRIKAEDLDAEIQAVKSPKARRFTLAILELTKRLWIRWNEGRIILPSEDLDTWRDEVEVSKDTWTKDKNELGVVTASTGKGSPWVCDITTVPMFAGMTPIPPMDQDADGSDAL